MAVSTQPRGSSIATAPNRARTRSLPETVTAQAAADVHLRDDLGEEGLKAATVVGHFAYGAAAGAVVAPLAGRTSRPVASGVGLGLALWAAGYLGWVPAFGLMRPATEQPAARNALMIAAHAVWGATTGTIVARAPNRQP